MENTKRVALFHLECKTLFRSFRQFISKHRFITETQFNCWCNSAHIAFGHKCRTKRMVPSMAVLLEVVSSSLSAIERDSTTYISKRGRRKEASASFYSFLFGHVPIVVLHQCFGQTQSAYLLFLLLHRFVLGFWHNNEITQAFLCNMHCASY